MNSVGIVGLGRVGTALACALLNEGYDVKTCSQRLREKEIVELEACTFKNVSLEQLAVQVDVIFLTVADSAIGQVVSDLSRVGGKAWGVLHMSGSISSQILKPLQEAGSLIGSLHPLQSFATVKEARQNLPGSYFTYEGDPDLLIWSQSLVSSLGGTLRVLPSPESKIIYHAGACLVSNYWVLLADLGISCLEEAGFDRNEAQRGLLPLMQGTLNNLTYLSPEKALTGPVARGDLEVVDGHLRKLQELLPKVEKAYRALTPLLGDLALGGGNLDKNGYARLLKLVNGGLNDDTSNS